MRCANCNYEIPRATAKFCPHCGAAVKKSLKAGHGGQTASSLQSGYQSKTPVKVESNMCLVLSVTCACVNAILVFCKWLEIDIDFYQGRFSLSEISGFFDRLQSALEYFVSQSDMSSITLMGAISSILSLSAYVIGVLGIVYIVFVIIKHPSRYNFGKKSALFPLGVCVVYIIFYLILASKMEPYIPGDILVFFHPTPIPFCVFVSALLQSFLARPDKSAGIS